MIKPLGQRVVVKRMFEEMRRGIMVPREAQKQYLVGRVVATGPDCEWVKANDVVHFAQYSGCLIKTDDTFVTSDYEECLYMNEEDILGLLGHFEEGKFIPWEAKDE